MFKSILSVVLVFMLVVPVFAEYDLENLPTLVPEEGTYAETNWNVDRIAGNTMAGHKFYQGPSLEIGGLQNNGPFWGRAVLGGDGTIYASMMIPGNEVNPLIKMEVGGNLRILMEKEGLYVGPIESCMAGSPVWNSYENTLYLSGSKCLRKVVKHGDGSYWVERVAGTCGTSGEDDGDALTVATLKVDYGVVCDDTGVCYWLEVDAVREINNGTVSTLSLSRPETPGHLFTLGYYYDDLSAGPDNDTLYISDIVGGDDQAVLSLAVSTGVLTRVAFLDGAVDTYNRAGTEADGPALTHVDGIGGMRAKYNAYHDAILISGADNGRIRWLRLTDQGYELDGWVRTIQGDTSDYSGSYSDVNSQALPAEDFSSRALMAHFTDRTGSIIFTAVGDPTGYWRLYNSND